MDRSDIEKARAERIASAAVWATKATSYDDLPNCSRDAASLSLDWASFLPLRSLSIWQDWSMCRSKVLVYLAGLG
ncbi:hypothetical protein PoB_001834400 [Plakobranchus ocellatus]|uniref:Uncharacterized protein n=1 Tax=Plakobranchus ocellatus TaxID=259542 RepID=A0AAV3ZD70_9GAST|nr:hypothetical protein PoB_001834400 [Plakobranchus ocellatus]